MCMANRKNWTVIDWNNLQRDHESPTTKILKNVQNLINILLKMYVSREAIFINVANKQTNKLNIFVVSISLLKNKFLKTFMPSHVLLILNWNLQIKKSHIRCVSNVCFLSKFAKNKIDNIVLHWNVYGKKSYANWIDCKLSHLGGFVLLKGHMYQILQ